jgi:small subunit ribosomal protein S33
VDAIRRPFSHHAAIDPVVHKYLDDWRREDQLPQLILLQRHGHPALSYPRPAKGVSPRYWLNRSNRSLQLRCKIFNTNFNPTNQRLGNKILRQRLKGHILADYYPPRLDAVKWIRNAYPQNLVVDEKEEYRLEQIELRKQRGKGTPKKRTIEGEHIDVGEFVANRCHRGENQEEERAAALTCHASRFCYNNNLYSKHPNPERRFRPRFIKPSLSCQPSQCQQAS